MTDYEKGVKDCFIATKTWVAVRLSSLRFIAFLIFFLYAFLDILHITTTQKHMLHFLS